jgi:hypothetical protein
MYILSKVTAYPTEDPEIDELNIQFYIKFHHIILPHQIRIMSEHGSRIIFRRILRSTLWGQAAHESNAVLAVMNIHILLPQIEWSAVNLPWYVVYLSETFLEPQHFGHHNYWTPQTPTLNRRSTQRPPKSRVTSAESVLRVSQKKSHSII